MRNCPCIDYEVVIRILNENKELKEENDRLRSLIEEAERTIISLKEEIKLLKDENYNLKETLLYTYQYGIKKKLKEEKLIEETSTKKRGAPIGHKGKSRNRPKQINFRIERSLDECPKCKSKEIKKCSRVDSHVIEDIIVQKISIEILYPHYYCYRCKNVVSAHQYDEFPYKRIGPVARMLASYLHNCRKVSYGDIKGIFKDLFDLELSGASFCGFDSEICKRGEPFYEDLKEVIRLSSVTYSDETGWQIGKDGAWLWAFVSETKNNKKVVLYKIDKRRSGDVAKSVLGEEYDGILASDRYSGYNRIEAKAKQKSIGHILKEIKDIVRLWNPDGDEKMFLENVKDLLQNAVEIKNDWKAKKISSEEVAVKREEFQKELEKLIQKELENKRVEKLRKSLARYKDEIFPFLRYFEVEPYTHIVERAIRLSVMLRKITYGNNSRKGARNHEVIMSLTQTTKANGQQPIRLLKELIIKTDNEDKIKDLLYGNVDLGETCGIGFW